MCCYRAIRKFYPINPFVLFISVCANVRDEQTVQSFFLSLLQHICLQHSSNIFEHCQVKMMFCIAASVITQTLMLATEVTALEV